MEWISNEDTFRAAVYLCSYLLLVILIGIYSAIKNVKRVANNDKINESNFATMVLAHSPSTQLTTNHSETHPVPAMISMDILTSKHSKENNLNNINNNTHLKSNININNHDPIEKSVTNSGISITMVNNNSNHNDNNGSNNNINNP